MSVMAPHKPRASLGWVLVITVAAAMIVALSISTAQEELSVS
jgi:hypothetical protein